MFALKVDGGFQGIDSSGFSVKQEEVFLKFFVKVEPVDEMKMTSLRFMFKFVRRPAVSMSCFHIQYCPNCKANCSLKKCSKCHAHLRASKSTSRGSKDVQLHNNELKYITYLAGDPKRKE